MGPQVLLEGRALLEGLPAGSALEAPLTRLEELVRDEVHGGAEALPAPAAGVGPRPRVQAAMEHQPCLLREGLVALRAPEGPLSRVQAAVCLQVRGLQEAPLARVAAQVEGEVRGGDLGPAADGAAERLHPTAPHCARGAAWRGRRAAPTPSRTARTAATTAPRRPAAILGRSRGGRGGRSREMAAGRRAGLKRHRPSADRQRVRRSAAVGKCLMLFFCFKSYFTRQLVSLSTNISIQKSYNVLFAKKLQHSNWG